MRGGRHWIVFGAEEMMKRHSIEMPVPDFLEPPLERYLSVYRNQLLRGRRTKRGAATDALWLSRNGQPACVNGIARRMARMTTVEFGHRISFQMFRTSAARSIAEVDPARTLAAVPLLGQLRPTRVERITRQTKTVQALREYHTVIDRLRKGG